MSKKIDLYRFCISHMQIRKTDNVLVPCSGIGTFGRVVCDEMKLSKKSNVFMVDKDREKYTYTLNKGFMSFNSCVNDLSFGGKFDCIFIDPPTGISQETFEDKEISIIMTCFKKFLKDGSKMYFIVSDNLLDTKTSFRRLFNSWLNNFKTNIVTIPDPISKISFGGERKIYYLVEVVK